MRCPEALISHSSCGLFSPEQSFSFKTTGNLQSQVLTHHEMPRPWLSELIASEQRRRQSRSFRTHLFCWPVWTLFHHKELLLWRSCWAPEQLQNREGLVLIGSGQITDAEVYSASTDYVQQEIWVGLVSFFRLQNMDEFVYRKEGYLPAQRDVTCQVLTSVSLTHHSTQWNSVLKKK